MKDKNKRLILIVGILLVIVLGVSFAYFLSSILISGEGTSLEGTTSIIKDTVINVEGIIEFNDLDILPGHKNISKIKVTATGNDELVSYNVIWEGINTLNTPLKYYVYKATTSEEPSITCTKESERVETSIIYYESCTNKGFDNLGEVISSGEITNTEIKKEYNIKAGEVIKGTEEGNVVYYYVVLEYPNLDESQNIDTGGKFEGKVTVKIGEEIISDIAITKIYKSTENGYEQIREIPGEEYEINEEKSTCTNNAKVTTKGNKILITGLTQSATKCELYYDKDTTKPTISEIIASATRTEIEVEVIASDDRGVTEYWYGIDNEEFIKGENNTYTFTELDVESTHTIKVYVKDAAGNQSETTTKSVETLPEGLTINEMLSKLPINTEPPDFSQRATTDEGVFKVEDPVYGGYSYYWRGRVINNYVKFAGKCWRMVRVNGDGTLRLIYDGTDCMQQGTHSSGAYSSVEPYNVDGQPNYVGWTYEGTLQRPVDNATATSANIKTQLESWYDSNLASYASKIADGKYCNDREAASGYTWSIEERFDYAAYKRLYTDRAPTLDCNPNDVYTLKIGLITADEATFAGHIVNAANTATYLYRGIAFWTMTPYKWTGRYARLFAIEESGNISQASIYARIAVRPVVNLKANTTFILEGDGTYLSPYVVQ